MSFLRSQRQGLPLKVMVIFGTRPEIIKMAPVIRRLQSCPEKFEVIISLTAQHREMADDMLAVFDLIPQYDLNLMRHGQTLPEVTASVLLGIQTILAREAPHLILIQGDTATVFATALAAFYANIPVGHIEAGLRTHSKYDPFPEEMMRRMTAPLTDLHFAPTWQAREHLVKEGIPPEAIYITGNTVIDALLDIAAQERPLNSSPPLEDREPRNLILVTAHRRENWGQPLKQICLALKEVASRFEDTIIVYAMHRNPKIRQIACAILQDVPRIHLIDPPNYRDFVSLMKRATLILTDSGGLQEEAPSLGVPVLILRRTTERPEGITAGTAQLVGVETNDIVSAVTELLTQPEAYQRMARAVNPYGDGRAAERIVEAILYAFGHSDFPPADFYPSSTPPA
jgi:UDP-N-acetylglucosamine 2-epimerase (non-hydrolysing)